MPDFYTTYEEPNPAQCEAIGRVAARWSVVEFALEVILARLIGAPDHFYGEPAYFPALALTNSLNMDNRLKALGTLLDLHETEQHESVAVSEAMIEELRSLRSKIDRARIARNQIIHWVWYQLDENTVFGNRFNAHGSLERRRSVIKTTQEINEFAEELERLGAKIFGVADRLRDGFYFGDPNT